MMWPRRIVFNPHKIRVRDPDPTRAEEYLRGKQDITIHFSYDEEDGWFVIADELEGVLLYAETVYDALYLLGDAIQGHAEAVLDENQSGSSNGEVAHFSR
jgi:predicted RNase H-like HicB family nuclease